MCTVTRAGQSGLLAFLGRFRRRYALLTGLALSLATVCVLSQFVLTVEVAGNQRVPTAVILSELRRQGLRPGAYGPPWTRPASAPAPCSSCRSCPG